MQMFLYRYHGYGNRKLNNPFDENFLEKYLKKKIRSVRDKQKLSNYL